MMEQILYSTERWLFYSYESNDIASITMMLHIVMEYMTHWWKLYQCVINDLEGIAW